MKFFFIKSILLITLVFILGITIRSFLPYMVSAPLNYVKHKTFEDKKDKLDILFLGTSRTHNGFSPTVFEKELQKISNTKYSAFNYGIGGASMGESVALFHRVLEDENYKGKYLVVELAAVTHSLSDQFFGENLHTTKNKYWLDKQMLEFSLQNTKGFDTQLYNADQKRDFTKNYMLLYISNLFNIGIWNDAIPTFLDEKNNLRDFGVTTKGFFAKKGKVKKHGVSKWIKTKLQPEISKRRQASIEAFEKNAGHLYFNEAYFKSLMALIRKAETANKHLLFLVPPLLAKEHYYELKLIVDKLPKKNIIELTNAKKYPGLYNVENVYDRGHLNNIGAKIYSRLLASEFEKSIGKNNKKGKKANENLMGNPKNKTKKQRQEMNEKRKRKRKNNNEEAFDNDKKVKNKIKD